MQDSFRLSDQEGQCRVYVNSLEEGVRVTLIRNWIDRGDNLADENARVSLLWYIILHSQPV